MPQLPCRSDLTYQEHGGDLKVAWWPSRPLGHPTCYWISCALSDSLSPVTGMEYQLGVRDFLECTWHPRLPFCLREQALRLESITKGDHQEGSEEEAAIRDRGWHWQGLTAELLSGTKLGLNIRVLGVIGLQDLTSCPNGSNCPSL